MVIDDHPVITKGLHWLFSSQARTTLFEVAHSLDSAIDQLSTQELDHYLILLDLNLPGVSGFDGFDRLRRHWPTLKIAIYSGHEDREIVIQALQRQAVGFIPKSTHPDLVVDAVFLMLDGGVYIPQAIIRSELNVGVGSQPTKVDPVQQVVNTMPARRLEVLKLLARGSSNKEICRKLNMSINTVKTHVSLVYASFDVHSRSDLIALLYSKRRAL